MEIVSAPGNWKLTVRRGDDGVAILRASTCDEKAALPDELFGLPVTELADRALKPDASPVAGEELTLICGPAEGEFDNRRIRELTLPQGLKTIGEYALMNCSAMHTLSFSDSIDSIGSTALMNCRALQFIRILRTGDTQGTALHSIVSGMPRELDVSILSPDGETMRLIFPEYYELYTEIGPSHYFNYTVEGSGFPYHQVCRGRRLDVKDYDALWEPYLATGYEEDTALRLAWWRVRYPAGLTEGTQRAYMDFLNRHAEKALAFAIGNKDIPGLNLLLQKLEIQPEALDGARSLARELHFTEATAILLEKQHRSHAGGRNRSFAL